MRTDLGPLGVFECALEQCAHDAGLNELPIGFGRGRERADFAFVQLEDSGFFKEMPVEMFDLVFAETAAPRHFGKKFFERFGEMLRIIDALFENFRDNVRREQPSIFSEETKHNAVEKPSDAEILSLRNRMFPARLRVSELDR